MPSHTVYATDNYGVSTLSLDDEDITSGALNIREIIFNGNWVNFGSFDNVTMTNGLTHSSSVNISNSSVTNFYDSFEIDRTDGATLFDEGESFSLSMKNLTNYILINNTRYNFSDISAIKHIKVKVVDMFSNAYYVDSTDYTFSAKDGKLSFDATFNDMPCDVYHLSLFFYFDALSAYGINSSYFNNSSYTVTRYYGFDNSEFSFKTEDKTTGLLSGIIELIRSIITGITELPTKIKNALSSLFDLVVNAITNLGNFIIDGIKNLFIPSEEDITNMKDKWDALLSDRFGALYQVGTLISDYAAAFTEQSKGTITFPSVTIPLAGAEFTFGGWEVQVVPDGFGVVFDTLKLITSILATLLFANGLKKRFDKLLGGADDI